MMSLYCSRAIRRFTTLSGASKREKTQLLQTEFGLSVFTTWKDIFTDDPPLSPPSLIHISLGGITPSCHVSCPNLLIVYFIIYMHVYSRKCTYFFPQVDEILHQQNQ